ncbi:MAG: GerMN domain-containing protein, partial [Acidothermales bacterium]|nr:GerMN domain-containing protein [Acidothermales bacterium]
MRRSRVLLAALLAAAALLAGCASIPTSGPVQVGHGGRSNGQGQQGQEPIQVFAQRPHPGWTPAQIVTGFLAAMASPDADHAVARSYLTPDIRENWPTGQSTAVVVYARDENFRLDIGRDNTVTVSAAQVATISNRREYQPSPRDATMHAVFRMQRVDGQWRIGSLPGNLLLDETDAVSGYVPFDLYFFSRSADVLVPDSVVLPAADSDEWAAELLRGLLAGPTPSVADGVESAIPEGTTLDAQPVLDSDGTLSVALGGAASTVSGEARQHMIAEIVATLMRVDGVSRVRVQTDATQTAPAYRDDVYAPYDPSGVVVRMRGYFVRDGKLLGIDPSSADVEPLKGPFGTGALPFKTPAVSLDATRAAAVSPSGHDLYVGPLDAAGKPELLYRGTALSSPSWDRGGDLWVVDNGSRGPRVLVFRHGKGAPVTALVTGLG